jgi:CMP-2-keto-3-deoxyoctulosonic acid synthetase
LRHIGVYAYTRSSLRTFSDSDASIEEENEKLEQLRAYGLKLRIIVGKASVTPGPDVDTYEDLLLVKSIYNSPKS